MFNPISLHQDDYLQLKGNNLKEKESYVCKNILNFSDAQKSLACRYLLQRLNDKKEIWLEVKKDRAQNYQLFYYEEIQQLEHSSSFLSLAGVETIAFKKPDKSENEQTIYSRVKKKGEEVMSIKHITSKDELPKNPYENGYNKDGNGNWYFMTRKSKGTLKSFDNNQKRRSWEYKHNDSRLLIEMEDINNTLSNITIYEGKEIKRRDIKKVIFTDIKVLT